ncbi:OmpA family protein [Lutibacter flavus]|uniref:Thrombospondin type 3 repeat-containing protein n=1 Tax=Lutibacter flavus TaxID=691689 RepID=A0A238WXT9_9FLAO|nr:OmpA family protein [Lutibacter flavus]SNR51336.1 Thrombospondin type 3 repeat-containing protein [Lutibacter flavus]
MKNIKVVLFALILVLGISTLKAQDNNNPWSIGLGVNAVDFYPTNPGLEGHGSWLNEFVNAGDHFNMVPSISKVTVGKYLTDGFSIEAAGSINTINKIGDNTSSDDSYFSLDGAVKYDLNEVFGETAWFDPYASVGGGYVWMDNFGTGTFNGALGFNLWFNENFGFNLESKYKHAFESNIVQHFQHSAGIIIKFGGTDKDGDGIYDKDDACPDVFGLVEYNGCPDADNDGVIDSKDDCPNVAGLESLNGCPDADGDGITDADDACPNDKGIKANKGCPDSDGDGVVDKNDKCPSVAGPEANNGCPWPDTDGDGVLDKDDNCINVVGTASNNGCPEITAVEVAKLEDLFKTVYFDTSKDSFKSETIARLDEAAQIMAKYPTAKFAISGHTDSVGNNASNLKLSEKRATAVKNYLTSKGVSGNNLTAKGFGEDMPIASNNTKSGRAENRRVEVKLVN